MAQRINWDKMYNSIREIAIKIDEEVHEAGLGNKIIISVGKKPPRIYATYQFDEQDQKTLENIQDDFSPEADAEHREILLSISKSRKKAKEIAGRYQLKKYASVSRLGEKCPADVYGFEHSQFRI